ncbi:MAG TPA: hypothetical protein VL588_02215, partial [Bdellovibrionota bacterium]|nr:hypothetical protein [Bdellovibrionota bacterium]
RTAGTIVLVLVLTFSAWVLRLVRWPDVQVSAEGVAWVSPRDRVEQWIEARRNRMPSTVSGTSVTPGTWP